MSTSNDLMGGNWPLIESLLQRLPGFEAWLRQAYARLLNRKVRAEAEALAQLPAEEMEKRMRWRITMQVPGVASEGR